MTATTGSWPWYAQPNQMANEVIKHSPCGYNGQIRIARIARTNRIPKISYLHTFGCPAYVL